jgi:PAS domain S-box-containing protein
MAKVVWCRACGDVAGALTCTSCGAEPVAGGIDQIQDQAASDRDKTAEYRDRAAERRDRGAEDRDALARQHEQTASDRDGMASDQDQTWSDHDQTASGSDQRTADADQQAADDDFAAGGDVATYRQGVLARKQTRRDRGSASVSRDQTTAARLQGHDADTSRKDILPAGHDREEAAGDREQAAHDRVEAADDREEALRNRTEFAAAAQRAVETLESMSDAFFTLDSEWRFTYLNPQTEAILERRREDLLGKNMWEEFPESVGSPFYDEYQRALRDQVPVRFEEDYEPLGRTLEVRAYPVTGGLAVYFRDVTSERLLDARLRQTQRLEALGRVTAGVAHDFNNLLTAVRGFAHLGQAASVDEETTSYFAEIDSAGQKAGELTRQLLAFGRQQDLSPTVIDLNDVVDGLSSLLRHVTPAGIELRFALSTQPVPVFVDPSQLEQVLLNLVVNSRDAIDRTGSITVSTTTDSPAGVVHDIRVPSGWLQVTDTGSGIPADVRTHIFDPFFTTKPPETGTGLGLATIYGIVSQSGGSIFVDSTLGVGTTMTLALPAEHPSGPPTSADTVGRSSASASSVSPRNATAS